MGMAIVISMLLGFWSYAAHAQALLLEPDSVEVGQPRTIQVFADWQGLDVTAFGFDILYDSTLVRFDTLLTDGTVCEDVIVVFNGQEAGRLRVASAGVFPKPDDGPLVNLIFTGLSPGVNSLVFGQAVVNELTPQVVNAELKVVDKFLPVAWREFFVWTPDEITVIARWATSSEINVSHFEVWRRRNTGRGGFGFQKIGESMTTGVYGGGYSWLDNNVVPGTYEYFVRAVDFDLTFEDIGPMAIIVNGPGKSQAYPNPIAATDQTLWLNTPPSDHVESTYEIYDILGRRVSRGAIPVSTLDDTAIDVSGYASGIYLVRVTHGYRREVHRVVRM